METLYKAYKGKAQFFLVYTREIHPSAKKSSPPRRPGGPTGITQHTSMKERVIAADKCMKGLKLSIPFLLDTMDNSFLKAYGGIPAGTAVIDINGKLAYWNPGAPNGCRPPQAKEALDKLLANGGGAIPAKWAPVKIPSDKPAKKPAKAAKAAKAKSVD